MFKHLSICIVITYLCLILICNNAYTQDYSEANEIPTTALNSVTESVNQTEEGINKLEKGLNQQARGMLPIATYAGLASITYQ